MAETWLMRSIWALGSGIGVPGNGVSRNGRKGSAGAGQRRRRWCLCRPGSRAPAPGRLQRRVAEPGEVGGAARPEVSKAAMPTKAPVKEACSPRPASSEIRLASSSGPTGVQSPPVRQKKRWRASVDLDGELDRAVGQRQRAVEREAQAAVGPVAGAAHHRQHAAEGGVVADGEEVELVAVVVGRRGRRPAGRCRGRSVSRVSAR